VVKQKIEKYVANCEVSGEATPKRSGAFEVTSSTGVKYASKLSGDGFIDDDNDKFHAMLKKIIADAVAGGHATQEEADKHYEEGMKTADPAVQSRCIIS
jgi:hypothetical protein